VAVAGLAADPVGVLLFDAGTEDVLGQLDQAVACGGGDELGCPTAGLHFEAEVRGTYLLDVYSTGSIGDYRLTRTVRNAAGLPIEVAVPACSPNGDGVQNRCAWTAGAIAGWTITSFVTSGAASAARRDGGGAHTWDGGGSAPGAYTLWVLHRAGQRLRWTGKTWSGAFLWGTFSYVIEATDAAGNTSRSRRHRIRVL
jgi:hypothetical protein